MSAQQRLKPPEWVGVLLVVAVLAWGATVALLTQAPTLLHIPNQSAAPAVPEVTLMITGEVAHPGTYRVPKGTSLGEALVKAQPTPLAQLSRYKLSRPLKRSESLRIGTRPLITIEVCGAVRNPGHYLFPKGATLTNLLTTVDMDENSNVDLPKSGRKLKDGETIEISSI